jgi:hypothetical protein
MKIGSLWILVANMVKQSTGTPHSACSIDAIVEECAAAAHGWGEKDSLQDKPQSSARPRGPARRSTSTGRLHRRIDELIRYNDEAMQIRDLSKVTATHPLDELKGLAVRRISRRFGLAGGGRSDHVSLSCFSARQLHPPLAAPQPFAKWNWGCIPSWISRALRSSCQDPSDRLLHPG